MVYLRVLTLTCTDKVYYLIAISAVGIEKLVHLFFPPYSVMKIDRLLHWLLS